MECPHLICPWPFKKALLAFCEGLFLSFVVVGVRQRSTLLCVGERGRGQYSDVRVCWVERKHGKEEKKEKQRARGREERVHQQSLLR